MDQKKKVAVFSRETDGAVSDGGSQSFSGNRGCAERSEESGRNYEIYRKVYDRKYAELITESLRIHLLCSTVPVISGR